MIFPFSLFSFPFSLFIEIITKGLPIYSPEKFELYKGQKRNTLPPHLFALADAAFSAILQSDRHQSVIITGESGAIKKKI